MFASRASVSGALVLGLLTLSGQAHAEPAASPPRTAAIGANASSTPPAVSAASMLLGAAMQRAITVELRRADASLTASPPSRQPDDEPERKRGIGRAILGAATGAVAGFFAGAYLGASLEPDCNCDDPGLRGVLIGAPIGAVAGGIVGAKWFF